MRSEITNPVSSFIRKLTRIFLTASLAIGGLAAALPQPVQATPDAPTAPVSDMGAARIQHTASLLHNGKVLVVGGRNGSGVIGSAELYDMTTGRWSATSGVSPAREGHTATTLLNGKVLVVGGSNGASALNNAATYTTRPKAPGARQPTCPERATTTPPPCWQTEVYWWSAGKIPIPSRWKRPNAITRSTTPGHPQAR